MTILSGNGYWIWKIKDCENGDVNAIAAKAKASGLSHVVIKVADGPYIYNINPLTRADRVPALVTALRAVGVSVWGYQYIYGNDPKGEAAMAIRRVKDLGLDGFVVDAEGEYQSTGMLSQANFYMATLRSGVKVPLAISSYRFPKTYQPTFPIETFLGYADIAMPQVYWVGATNSAEQLECSYNEYSKMANRREFAPAGAAYHENGWQPTPEQITAFGAKAKELGLQSVNWWEWGNSCRYGLFDAAADSFGATHEPTLAERVAALEARVTALEQAK